MRMDDFQSAETGQTLPGGRTISGARNSALSSPRTRVICQRILQDFSYSLTSLARMGDFLDCRNCTDTLGEPNLRKGDCVQSPTLKPRSSKTPLPGWNIPFLAPPQMTISNGKLFHHLCPGSGLDDRNLGCKCSALGVLKIWRSFL